MVRNLTIVFVCSIFMLFSGLLCFSDEAATRKSLEHLIKYLDLKNVSPDDLTRLTGLKSKAEHPGLNDDERKAAYEQLVTAMLKVQGGNPSPPIVNYYVGTAMAWSCSDARKEDAKKRLNAGELGAVVKHGSGGTTVILIPDLGLSAGIFDRFMQRNESNYRMYAVTLPGFGGTALPPEYSPRDYTLLRLWKNAETGIMNLIRKEKIKDPVLVGIQGGSYLAMRLALDHPGSFKSVVVLNGLLYSPLQLSKEAKPVDKAQRHNLAKVFLPVQLLPKPSEDCYYKYWLSYTSAVTKDGERAKALARDGSLSDPYVTWDYGSELLTTDLAEEISNIKIPFLVVSSIPANKPAPVSLTQWQQVKMPNLKLVPFENTGAYATEDNPERLDQTIAEFVAKQK